MSDDSINESIVAEVNHNKESSPAITTIDPGPLKAPQGVTESVFEVAADKEDRGLEEISLDTRELLSEISEVKVPEKLPPQQIGGTRYVSRQPTNLPKFNKVQQFVQQSNRVTNPEISFIPPTAPVQKPPSPPSKPPRAAATTTFSSQKEISVMKKAELIKISRLEAKGYSPYKKMTMMDSYSTIHSERLRLEEARSVDEAIKWQRKALMSAVSGIEYVNTKWNPVGLRLEGWSETVFQNITDYDEVFEELYYKYKDYVTISPELKLLGMLGGSAMMFHFSKVLFSKAASDVPGFNDVMNKNPELKKAYQEAAMKDMAEKYPETKASKMAGDILNNEQLGRIAAAGLPHNNNLTFEVREKLKKAKINDVPEKLLEELMNNTNHKITKNSLTL